MSARRNLTGSQHGALTILEDDDEASAHDARKVVARCSCGARVRVPRRNLCATSSCPACVTKHRDAATDDRSALTDEQIRELRAAYERGENMKLVAKRMGIAYQTAVDCGARRTFSKRAA